MGNVGATVLATGKGWVLAMLPVLPAKRRVRAGPRGSGPGAKRRRPCSPLRAAAARRRRDEGRPDPSTHGLRPGSNKGLMGNKLDGTRQFLSSHFTTSIGHRAAKKAYQGGPRGLRGRLPVQRLQKPPRGFLVVWQGVEFPRCARGLTPASVAISSKPNSVRAGGYPCSRLRLSSRGFLHLRLPPSRKVLRKPIR